MEKESNPIEYKNTILVTPEAQQLYDSLDFFSDLHCDALLWDRDITKRVDFAHFDFPRMQKANMALQAFTIVKKSPMGQNFRENSGDAFDMITLLNFLQDRAPDKWISLYKRAEFQARTFIGTPRITIKNSWW